MKRCASESVCPCRQLGAKSTPLLYSECCGRFVREDGRWYYLDGIID